MVYHFIGGYVIKRTLQGRLDIKIFSPRVEKYFTNGRNTRREIPYLRARPCNIILVLSLNTSTSPHFCYVYFSCILLGLLTYSAFKKYKRVVLYKA